MTTLADSLISSSSRPLSVRKRPDLTSSRHMYQGTSYWVVKEPVGLQYFRFHDEEYFILQMLDGHVSLQQIKDGFEQEFAPQKITFGDLQQFLGMLHRSGLVISNSPGQGGQLRKRGSEKKKKELLGKLANIFAIRFRGIDPEGILRRMNPVLGWVFTVPALIFFVGFGLITLILVGMNFELFRSKLPSFQEFFAAENWLYMGLLMAVVKICHEFGHGLSCKRFGGECHELGFMLLVFTPCLYCNVSDSWMLPNKWKRVWIGAGGMYVELILASFATWLWWFSEPGLLNFTFLATMFICSVSTVVFNANPLLRFDGYYILMDWLEIPNLRQKATETLKRWFQETCLGLELQENPFLPQRNRFMFGMFTVASVIYRWVVVIGIVMFLNQVLEPYGLRVIGRLFAIIGFGGLIAKPIWESIKFIRTPGRMQKVKRSRLAATVAVAGTVIAAFCFVPLPYHIKCAFEVRPADPRSVYAGTPGQIEQVLVKPGDEVREGDTLAILKNSQLTLKLADLESEERIADVRLASLSRLKRYDSSLSGQTTTQKKMLDSVTELRRKAQEEIDQLQIKAPISGVIIPPPDKPDEDPQDGRLPEWSGSPLDTENIGALMTQESLICMIGDPRHIEAVLIVDQGDIQLIQEGDSVELKPDARRLEVLHGKIDQVSRTEMKYSPASLSSQSGGDLDTQVDPETGNMRPINASYQARVPLPEVSEGMRVGYRGTAKISAAPKSLGWRFYRFLNKTFQFDF
nr:biotin/lipoyl-binding protein [Rosistilla oblonga]